jgi:hypothetical protein
LAIRALNSIICNRKEGERDMKKTYNLISVEEFKDTLMTLKEDLLELKKKNRKWNLLQKKLMKKLNY